MNKRLFLLLLINTAIFFLVSICLVALNIVSVGLADITGISAVMIIMALIISFILKPKGK